MAKFAIWWHDKIGEKVHLTQKDIYDFILAFEQIKDENKDDLGKVETRFSPGFLNALRNYKK